MPGRADETGEKLGAMLRAAADDPAGADPSTIAELAGAVFQALRRTDMRSGIANIIRRLALLADAGVQPISDEGWRRLADAAELLRSPNVSPGEIRALDDDLQRLGLDVDARPASIEHQPRPPTPN